MRDKDRTRVLFIESTGLQEVVYFKLKSYTVRFVNEMTVTSSCRAYIILLFITFCKIIVHVNFIARNWAHYLLGADILEHITRKRKLMIFILQIFVEFQLIQ